jgi:hypothetical protein
VVALDVRGPAAAAGLDHVRVEGALDEELDLLAVRAGGGDDLACRLLEDADELAADDLALRLRVGDAGQRVEEPLLRVDDHEVDPGGGHEVALDLLGLALPEQPVVDEDAGQLLADRPLHERRGDGRVDPAGQPAIGPLVPHLRADRATCSSITFAIVQVGRQPASSYRKCSRTVCPCGCAAPRGGTGRRRADGRRPRRPRRGPRLERAVTANPGGAAVTASPCDIHTGCCPGCRGTASSLPRRPRAPCRRTRPARALDRAAQRLGHRLEAVADAEDGHAGLEQRRVERGAPSA